MQYLVEISKNDKLLFKVEIKNINQINNEEALQLLFSQFTIEAGYQRHVFYSDSETRYLKSTNQSMELLAALPIYQSLGLQ